MEDEDEFDMECSALEAIFEDSFRKESDRNISLAIEPVTPDGEQLSDWVFSLKMRFPARYPSEIPSFNLASLENTMYSAAAKKELKEALEEEASNLVGEQMVYTLVEWLKEHLLQYVEISKQEIRKEEHTAEKGSSSSQTSKDIPKEKMTKAQKRRFYSRFGAVDEKPRGWNWVDIISHLSSRPAEARQRQ